MTATDYEVAAGKVAVAHLRSKVRPCKNCGHPFIDGLICTYCRDVSPNCPGGCEAPIFDASAPIPPARDPNETYRASMAEIEARTGYRVPISPNRASALGSVSLVMDKPDAVSPTMHRDPVEWEDPAPEF